MELKEQLPGKLGNLLKENIYTVIEKDSFYYYSIGLKCFKDEDFDGAIENFNQSLKLDEHFKTYHRIAEIFEKQGLFKESYTALEKAYGLNPRNDKLATSFAGTLQKNGNTKRAKEILNETLKRNPSYGPAKRMLEQFYNYNMKTEVFLGIKLKQSGDIININNVLYKVVGYDYECLLVEDQETYELYSLSEQNEKTFVNSSLELLLEFIKIFEKNIKYQTDGNDEQRMLSINKVKHIFETSDAKAVIENCWWSFILEQVEDGILY